MKRSYLGDLFGSFADTAILLPLIALLSSKSGFDPALLLLTSGLAYIVAGKVFAVPMSVQPLKSIAIAAVSIGASIPEIQISGFLLGAFCLALLYFDVNEIAKKIPTALIQNIQFGLGVLLIEQAFRNSTGDQINLWIGGLVIVAFLMIERLTRFSWLGIFATLITLYALGIDTSVSLPTTMTEFRWSIVVGLVIPQMILTIGNSILGTVLTVQRYFPERAQKITPRKLLLSVGLGNMVSACIAGLPFCHGSGGVTAHVKGGSTSSLSNMIIGSFLTGLGLFLFFSGNKITFLYPTFALTALLGTVGFHHLKLAQDLLINHWRLAELIVSAAIVLVSHNLLFVFAWAVIFEFVFIRRFSIIRS